MVLIYYKLLNPMKSNHHLIIAMLAMIFQFLNLEAQSVDSLPLYTGKIPYNLPGIKLAENSYINENGHYLVTNVSEPELYVYLPAPEKATGASVIICPGGVTGSSRFDTKVMISPNGSRKEALPLLS